MCVFELALDRKSAYLRIGRWTFRTWRSYVIKLPSGFRSPLPVYAVQLDDDGEAAQLGVFFDLEMAEACLAQLESEGHADLVINHMSVHSRLEDWKWDR